MPPTRASRPCGPIERGGGGKINVRSKRRNGFHKMSLPRELLDQLLSGYLDDALSADERARVEQLLRSDDQIVKELDQLRQIQNSLRSISVADSEVKLDSGFADRVLGEAVARAHAEGLGEDHPLIRLAEQPSTSHSTAKANRHHDDRFSSMKTAGVLVGLAASIVFAVIALRPAPGPIAQTQPQPEPQPGALVDASPVERADSQTQLEPRAQIDDASLVDDASLANVDNTAPTVAENAPEATTIEDATEPAPEMIASDPTPTSATSPDRTETPVPPEGKTDRMQTPTAPIESIANANLPEVPDLAKLRPIMILDVRLTEAGRDSDSIGQALKAAGIPPASEKKISDKLAGFVKSTQPKAEKDASILYLQTSGKKIDRFYFAILQDLNGVETVGWRLAFEAPVMQIVDAIKPDPTLVRHDDSALQLFSDGGMVDEFTQKLREFDYPLQDRNKVEPPITKGPDIKSQILVLVNQPSDR